jgi:hypothetical protein
MTAMASDDLRHEPPQPAAGRDASYETYLRVKNGVSDAALRAAGLPPAQSLTYDEYLASVGAKNARKDDTLDRLRGSQTPRLEPIADPVPGPPPLGRRLVLDEAPDGSWRIAADPHQRPHWNPSRPPGRRVFAKIVGMSMGIAVAFVAAAYLNAVYLRGGRSAMTSASLPTAAPATANADVAPKVSDPVSITVTDPGAALGLETASGEDDHIVPDTSWAETAPQPQTASGGAAPSPPVTAPKKAPTQQVVKPADLPNSTPTATQRRLPNTTQVTRGASSYTKPASTEPASAP